MPVTRQDVVAWLDSAEPGWSPDDVDPWLERGRRLGPEVLPVLHELRREPLSAFRTRGVQVALNAYDHNANAAYFPYYWAPHTRITSPRQLEAVAKDTIALSLDPPAKTTDFEAYAPGLARLQQVESIWVTSGQPATLEFLQDIRQLQDLQLPDRGKSPLKLGALQHLNHLQYLHLGDAKHQQSEAIGHLNALKSLFFQSPPDDLSTLAGLEQLRFLRLHTFKAADLSSVETLPALEALYLDYPARLSTLDDARGGMANLRECGIAFARQLTDASALAEARPLEKLSLRGLPKLTDISWLESLPSLKELRIAQCPGLKDLSVIGRLHGIEVLELMAVPPVPSLALFSDLPALRHLFTIATRIKDGSYEPLYEMPNLLSYTGVLLGEKQVQTLRQAQPHLIVNGQEPYEETTA